MTQNQWERLIRLTENALKEAQAGPRLLVAVSGGADSVCLLLCACALRERGFEVTAAHVRHDLRETALRDERFVHDLCGRLDVPFRSAAVHVPACGSTEARAREVRYEALEGMYRAAQADALLLAHHQNDQAETVLMRLIRGCGAEGLAAMKPAVRHGEMLLLRPFLSVSAAEIRDLLQASGQPWCEDETNEDPRYTRNYLRRQILAPLESTLPGSVRGLCRSAEIQDKENDFLNQLTEEALGDAACLLPPCRFLLRDKLMNLHPALQRRVIRQFLSVCGTESGFEKTEEIRLALNHPPEAVNLKNGASLLFTEKRLHYVPETPGSCPVPEDFFQIIPGNGTGDGKKTQAFPAALYAQTQVRFARPGDVFQPFGHQKEVRLSRFLIDQKIDRPFRPFIPFICMENVVLWIPGVAASERLRLRPGEPSVTLTIRGRLPWECPAQDNQQEETSDGYHRAHLSRFGQDSGDPRADR